MPMTLPRRAAEPSLKERRKGFGIAPGCSAFFAPGQSLRLPAGPLAAPIPAPIAGSDRCQAQKASPPGLRQSERAAWTDAGWMGAHAPITNLESCWEAYPLRRSDVELASLNSRSG